MKILDKTEVELTQCFKCLLCCFCVCPRALNGRKAPWGWKFCNITASVEGNILQATIQRRKNALLFNLSCFSFCCVQCKLNKGKKTRVLQGRPRGVHHSRSRRGQARKPTYLPGQTTLQQTRGSTANTGGLTTR